MTLLQYGYQLVGKRHKALRTVCDRVPHHEDVSELITGMLKVMIEKGGIGLAAPQVGVTRRVILINYAALKTAIINPVIVKAPGKLVTSIGEGCLSFPSLRVDRRRHKRVIVKGYDENWIEVMYDLRGLSAFCIQHEIDHLNGITIDQEQVL